MNNLADDPKTLSVMEIHPDLVNIRAKRAAAAQLLYNWMPGLQQGQPNYGWYQQGAQNHSRGGLMGVLGGGLFGGWTG